MQKRVETTRIRLTPEELDAIAEGARALGGYDLGADCRQFASDPAVRAALEAALSIPAGQRAATFPFAHVRGGAGFIAGSAGAVRRALTTILEGER